MSKWNRFIIRYFIIVLPVAIIAVLFDLSGNLNDQALTNAYADKANSLLGVVLFTWMACTLYLGCALVISLSFREFLLGKIIRINERDEREQRNMNVAARQTFFSTLAILCLLFVISVFQFDLEKLPPHAQFQGRKHQISLGLAFSPWSLAPKPAASLPESSVLSLRFPFSVSAILLLLIGWQLFSLHWYSRRLAM